MRVRNLEIALVHYDREWRDQEQRYDLHPASGYPKHENDQYELRASWGTQAGTCVLSQRIRAESQSSAVYELDMKSRDGLPTNAIALAVYLPGDAFVGETIGVGQEAIVLPQPVGAASTLIHSTTAKRVHIPLDGGELVVDGEVPVIIQDNRPYGENSYMIRLSMTPNEGKLKAASLRLKFLWIPETSQEAKKGAN